MSNPSTRDPSKSKGSRETKVRKCCQPPQNTAITVLDTAGPTLKNTLFSAGMRLCHCCEPCQLYWKHFQHFLLKHKVDNSIKTFLHLVFSTQFALAAWTRSWSASCHMQSLIYHYRYPKRSVFFLFLNLVTFTQSDISCIMLKIHYQTLNAVLDNSEVDFLLFQKVTERQQQATAKSNSHSSPTNTGTYLF